MKNLKVVTALLLVIGMCAPLFAADKADLDNAVSGANKAVDFLIKQQNDDGTFGKLKGASMPGEVGLVVKALASSPGKLRENNPAVGKAAKFMLAQQQPTGAIADPKTGYENYNTSIAIIALVAIENPAYKTPLENAKKFVLSCQHDEEPGYKLNEQTRNFGGFFYGTSKRADLSNSGFSMEALNALGLEKDSPAWKNAVQFIKRCQDNDETNDLPEMKGGDNGGGMVYFPTKSEFGEITTKSGKKLPKPYGNMTYMGVKSLIYAGVKSDDPALQAAFKWIKNNYAVDHQPGAERNEGYYYYCNVMAKAMTAAGIKELELADGKKAHWAAELSAQLLKLQNPDGSFVNTAPRWMESDPVLSTAFALDALNLCINALK